MNLHFIGILFFFFGAGFYVTKGLFTGEIQHMLPKKGDLSGMIGHYKAMLFGGKAPKEEKFLSAERVVFPLWIIGVSGIILTGIIKSAAHIWVIPRRNDGDNDVLTWSFRNLHDVYVNCTRGCWGIITGFVAIVAINDNWKGYRKICETSS